MMGVLLEQAKGRDRVLDVRGHGRVWMFALVLTLAGWSIPVDGLTTQQHELTPQVAAEGHGTATIAPAQHVVGQGSTGASASQSDSTEHPSEAASGAPPAGTHEAPQSQQPSPAHPAPSHPAVPAHPQGKAQESVPQGHEALPGHGAEAALGEHGPALPEISPIPGVTFVETMIKLLDHEIHGRTLGWRPNDIILGRFTDNINNYQLGVLEALRFTTLRLKDSLTRMGDADAYDPDLEQALNLLMNRATLFWFPSAEAAYGEAIDHFKNFLRKLQTGQRSFYYRVDNLRLLISSYKDLLGNVNRNLIRSPVGWFETDDYFYYAKGVAHVYYEILRVVRVGYKSQLASTLNALDIMDEILHELHKAEQIDPWIVLDSDLDGFFANHRANLNAPLSEVAHLLGVMGNF